MDKIQKTKDYDRFIFRNDNRETISQTHVDALVESIQERNLLEVHPILVNEDWEIIDGQNRVLAAKKLGVPVYYIQKHGLVATDVIVMNLQKSWMLIDYLNFYVKNHYPEYLKLDSFMRQFRFSITVALKITSGKSRQSIKVFRAGQYVFAAEDIADHLRICLETIEYIQNIRGNKQWLGTAKLWAALLRMVRSKEFKEEKWRMNLSRMIERIEPKVNEDDYLRQFLEIFNWRNLNKIKMEYQNE